VTGEPDQREQLGEAGGGRAELTVPALLRAAGKAYASATRRALAEAGFDDMPRDGSYVVSGIARTGAPLGDIITALGASKQAAGQLVDTLVVRGYLGRAIDPDDRRRLTVSLTARGEAAAAAIRSAVDRVDADLASRVGPEFVLHTRATLAALMEVGEATAREAGEVAGP
jgi:DNA-binding MarR family transcriptional regulator